MKRMLVICATTLWFLAGSVQTHADLAPPRPQPSPPPKYLLNTGMVVVPDSKAYQARLEISQEALNELRTALANLPADSSPRGSHDGSRAGSFAQSISGSSGRTILAGLFLFLSLSFTGVWLARGGSGRSQRVAAAVLMGAAVIGAAAIITRGNAGPPPSYLWRNLSKNLTAGKPTQGSVDIEVVAEGKGIKFIIPVAASSGSNKRSDEE